jgi:hypothetical protein
MPKLLYLDDMRVPEVLDAVLVRNYAEFVAYVDEHGCPELVSFDHDLAEEAYNDCNTNPNGPIDYAGFREKTGLHCAQYLIDHAIPLQQWYVHSFNPVGRQNIERALRSYCPEGEVRVKIPYKIPGSGFIHNTEVTQ